MNHSEATSPHITSPDLANVIGYGMQASGYIDLAIEAHNEGEERASSYLWRKAYELGLGKGVVWLLSLAHQLPQPNELPETFPAYTPLQQEEIIQKVLATEAVPAQYSEVLSKDNRRKLAALLVTPRNEPLTRTDISLKLDVPPETVQRMVA